MRAAMYERAREWSRVGRAMATVGGGLAPVRAMLRGLAERFGIRAENLWDPLHNATASARYLRFLIDKFDGKLDLVAITFVQNTMTVFRQDSPSKWTVAQRLTLKNLHEGMDVGDIDGDGDTDIAVQDGRHPADDCGVANDRGGRRSRICEGRAENRQVIGLGGSGRPDEPIRRGAHECGQLFRRLLLCSRWRRAVATAG